MASALIHEVLQGGLRPIQEALGQRKGQQATVEEARDLVAACVLSAALVGALREQIEDLLSHGVEEERLTGRVKEAAESIGVSATLVEDVRKHLGAAQLSPVEREQLTNTLRDLLTTYSETATFLRTLERSLDELMPPVSVAILEEAARATAFDSSADALAQIDAGQ